MTGSPLLAPRPSTSAAAARSWTATPTDLYSVVSVGAGPAGPRRRRRARRARLDRRRVDARRARPRPPASGSERERATRRRSSPRGRSRDRARSRTAAKPTEPTCVPGRRQSSRTTGSAECVVAATTSAPRTASSNEAARAPISAASASAFARSRPATRISCQSRMPANARACERAWTPVPRIASTRASSRASRRAASAAATGGPRRRDVRPVHQRERRAVRRIEERDRRLVRRPVGVVREDGDELAAEPGRREIAGHRAEQAVLAGEGRDPRRHRDGARRELRVGARERVDELVEIEQLAPPRARVSTSIRRQRYRPAQRRCAATGAAAAAAAAASSRRAPPPRAAPRSRRRSRRAGSAESRPTTVSDSRAAARRRSWWTAPQASATATSAQLDEQHLPVSGRPEIVHVRQAQDAEVDPGGERAARRRPSPAARSAGTTVRRSSGARGPDDGDELDEAADPEHRRAEVHPVGELREPRVPCVRGRVTRERQPRGEARARARTPARATPARRSATTRKRSAVTSAKPSVMAMNACAEASSRSRAARGRRRGTRPNGSCSTSSARSRNAAIPTSSTADRADARHPEEAALGPRRQRPAHDEQPEAEPADDEREREEVEPAHDVLRPSSAPARRRPRSRAAPARGRRTS